MTATFPRPSTQVLLRNISWETYQQLVRELESQPRTRLTYDNGMLEIMTPLNPHEDAKYVISRLVDTLTEEMDVEVRGLGSSTWNRKDLAKGIEPDSCFYIKNEAKIRGKEQIDLNQDPPPDLAIEIDITSSSLNRMAIYAALGVPELWRYQEGKLTIYYLLDGEYQAREYSLALPYLRGADVVRFLEMAKVMGETSLIREFRRWIRQKINQEQ